LCTANESFLALSEWRDNSHGGAEAQRKKFHFNLFLRVCLSNSIMSKWIGFIVLLAFGLGITGGWFLREAIVTEESSGGETPPVAIASGAAPPATQSANAPATQNADASGANSGNVINSGFVPQPKVNDTVTLPPDPAAAAAVAPPAPVPTHVQPPGTILATEQFDNGPLQLSDCISTDLEAFLQDLNQRKDYDASQHNGQPGPDAPHLSGWVDKVTTELKSRGYYFDDAGNLHRPTMEIIAVR
jgi:hypothetical protein